MPRGRGISVPSLAVWWAKLKKNDKVRHNMTQIASLLVVATVFTWLMVCNESAFYSQRKGDLYARQKYLIKQEHELKCRGEGGRA